jgi:hypothetical protein
MIETWLTVMVIFTIIVLATIIGYIAKEVIFWEPSYMYYTSDPRDESECNWKFNSFYQEEQVYDETDDMIYSLYDED